MMIRYLDLIDAAAHHDVMDLEVNPGLLRRAASDVSAMQDRVQTILDDLRSDLSTRGTAWEQGTFGTAFAAGSHGYLAAADQLFQSAQNLATTMANYSSAMSQAADQLATADAESAPDVRS